MTNSHADEIITISFSLPRAIAERAQVEATRQSRSRSNQIAVILAEYFERQDKQAEPPTPEQA